MTPFRVLLNLAGLSQREAAAFLDVSPSAVDKMSRGARATPDGIVDELSELIDRQEEAADLILDKLDEADGAEVEIGYPTDDDEARSLGWPCVGAWAGMAARVIAGTDKQVALVPRGSTVATAAAADARERC